MGARGESARSFAGRLREVMRDLNVDQRGLAEAGGTTDKNVSVWLNGAVPQLRVLIPFAVRLGYGVEWLLTGRGERRPHPAEPETSRELVRTAIALLRRAEARMEDPSTRQRTMAAREAVSRRFIVTIKLVKCSSMSSTAPTGLPAVCS